MDKYLEQEQVIRIIDHVAVTSRHPDRDRLLVKVMWETGARVTEAVTLTIEHVGQSTIRLRNLKQQRLLKGAKRKVHDPDAMKDVQVSEELCTEIKKYCTDNDIVKGYVFYSLRPERHVSAWYVWYMLDKASLAAGVQVFGKNNPRTHGRSKGAYPHMLRHSNAMKLLDETKDITLVQKQLGHANVRTTQVYAYATEPKIKKAMKNIRWY